MGTEKDVSAFFQAQTLVYVGSLNLGKVVVEHFCHRTAGDVGALLRQAAVGKVATGVFGVGEVDVGDYVNDAAVGLLWQAFVLAAVACFHVEDGDMQAFSAYDGKAGVGVAQHENGIGLRLYHYFVGRGYDVAHGLAEVVAYGIHVYVGVFKLQVLKEYSVKVVVVVLSCMCEEGVEILAALVDDGCETYYFGACPYDNEQL